MELLIVRFPWGIFNFLFDEKKNLVEVHASDDGDNDIGSIYVGRVEQVKTNINSAFVRIDEGRKVFLSIRGTDDLFYTRKIGKSEHLVQGDELLVQVEKEAHKSKLAKATGTFVLSGRYVVLTTDKKKVFVSSKIEDSLRKTYKFKLKSYVTGGFGLIVRTNAQYVSIEEVEDEIRVLSQAFNKITASLSYKQVFKRIYRPMPKYLSMIRDMVIEDDFKISVYDEDIYDDIKGFLEETHIEAAVVYNATMTPKTLMDTYGLKEKLQKLHNKKVWLKSGATIVIESTEAMTVIDVNTEKTLSKKKMDETILKTNMEAAEMVMYQMRARNISGIVIIDFIDMRVPAHKEQLIQCFSVLCSKATIKTTLHGMTALGLIEVTRKKLEKPIWENEAIQALLNS